MRGKIRENRARSGDRALLSPHAAPSAASACAWTRGYYETFNRPNVRLVDVSRAPDRAPSRRAACAPAGASYEFDALVLATGFDAVTGTLMRLDLRGRGGLRIQDKWRAGPLNYLGLMIAGFPNLFNIAGPGSTSAFTNVIVSIEHHVDWIAECIAWLDAQRPRDDRGHRRGRGRLGRACQRGRRAAPSS